MTLSFSIKKRYISYALFVAGVTFCLSVNTLLIVDNANALTPAEQQAIIQQQKQIEQRQEQERQDTLNQIEQKEIQKIRDSRDFMEDEATTDKEREENGMCVTIKEIELEIKGWDKSTTQTYISNNQHSSTKNTSSAEQVHELDNSKPTTKTYRPAIKQSKLRTLFLDKYLNQCITKSDIAKIQSNIMDYYIGKGYTTARVYFDFATMRDKILTIIIYEGIVEDIELKSDSKVDNKFPFRNKTQLYTAFPLKKNKVFDLRDFEQGIDQMNRLSSNNVKMDIRPGSKDGYSKIILNNELSHRTNFTLAYDNSGQESTGLYKKSIAINQDNLFALNDNLYIKYTKDNAGNHRSKFSESWYTSFSIPLGYWKFTHNFSESKYRTTVESLNNNYVSEGDTKQNDFIVDRILFRNQRNKLTYATGLTLKDTESFVNDTIQDTGTRKLTLLTNEVKYIYYPKAIASSLYASLKYTRGTDWFNAKSDASDIGNSEEHAQFDKVEANFNTSVPLFKTPLVYKPSVSAQYSWDKLYASEGFSIGGQYSVRGFRESSVDGDIGYYVRNDITSSVYSVLPKKLSNKNFMNKTYTESKFFNISTNQILSNLNWNIFYDHGYARNKVVTAAENEGYMSGAGFGFGYYGKHTDWSVTYARALHEPKFLEREFEQASDSETIYFNMNVKFGVL